MHALSFHQFNALPNDKILDLSKFKAFADDTRNVAKMMIYVFDRAENIVGKGENAGYQHFLLFPQCFQKALSFHHCNSLPNDKILDLSKFKAFADDTRNVAKMMIYVFDRAENIVGKGENAGYQFFLHFPQCFQKAFSQGVLKVGIVSQRVTVHVHIQIRN